MNIISLPAHAATPRPFDTVPRDVHCLHTMCIRTWLRVWPGRRTENFIVSHVRGLLAATGPKRYIKTGKSRASD